MAEILSPGVFMEERASQNNVIASVSTSNMGIAGFSPQGPSDTATLVTSLPQFERAFGGDTKNSLLYKSVAAFYANGGKRAFVVRVMPSDAVAAGGWIQSQTTNQVVETGNGGTAYTQTSTSSALKDNGGFSPIVPGSLSLKFRGAGDTLTTSQAMAKDGVTMMSPISATSFEGRFAPYRFAVIGAVTVSAGVISAPAAIKYTTQLSGVTVTYVVTGVSTPLSVSVTGSAITVNVGTDGSSAASSTAAAIALEIGKSAAASALVTATLVGTGLGIVTAASSTPLIGIPAIDGVMDVLAASDVTVHWDAKTAVFPGASAGPIVAATVSADVLGGTLDRRTGIFSLSLAAATSSSPAALVTLAASALSDTKVATTGTVVSGTGTVALSGAATGTLSVIDGSYTVTPVGGATSFATGTKMFASYLINAWEMKPISKGTWGNRVSLSIAGNPNYYDATSNTFSRFNVTVLLQDPSTLQSFVVETFDELVFNDSTSSVFFPDVINALSSYIDVTEPGANEAPGQLAGVAQAMAIGGGDGTTSGKARSITLPGTPVATRSVTISYTSNVDSLVKTITDDGSGALVGSIDATGTNTITYSSGAIQVSTADLIKPGTLVTIVYRSAAAEALHTETLGNSAKAYSYTLTSGGTKSFFAAGTDGTITSSTYGRSQFTLSSLATSGTGIYALNRIDEIMQVILPDFAGDVLTTGDLLDFAENRANSPSGGDRFIILTTRKGLTPQKAGDWFRYELKRFSKFAALYYPWIVLADPLSNNRNLTVPPLGHIAGIYARTDATKNVGKSPGGTVDGQLAYLVDLEYTTTLGERDYLYQNKVNPLISSAQTGMAVWGVRTIAQESEWRYINARRLFMYIEKSVYNATHWIVFENNGPALWLKIKGQLQGFLMNKFNDGYFAGTSPSQAFFITCDETNNTQASIDAGQVIIDVGIAPNKPAEFVVFRISQITQ